MTKLLQSYWQGRVQLFHCGSLDCKINTNMSIQFTYLRRKELMKKNVSNEIKRKKQQCTYNGLYSSSLDRWPGVHGNFVMH